MKSEYFLPSQIAQRKLTAPPELPGGCRGAGFGQKGFQTLPCTVLCSFLPDHISDPVSTLMDSGVAHRAYTSVIFIKYFWLDQRC